MTKQSTAGFRLRELGGQSFGRSSDRRRERMPCVLERVFAARGGWPSTVLGMFRSRRRCAGARLAADVRTFVCAPVAAKGEEGAARLGFRSATQRRTSRMLLRTMLRVVFQDERVLLVVLVVLVCTRRTHTGLARVDGDEGQHRVQPSTRGEYAGLARKSSQGGNGMGRDGERVETGWASSSKYGEANCSAAHHKDTCAPCWFLELPAPAQVGGRARARARAGPARHTLATED